MGERGKGLLALCVGDGVGEAGVAEALETELTGVAFAAAGSVRERVVAGVRHRIINAKRHALLDDLGFGKVEQRRVEADSVSFDSDLRRQIGHRLKRFEKFGTTVRVPAVVHVIDAKKNIERADRFRVRESYGEENGVTRRNVRVGNVVFDVLNRSSVWDRHAFVQKSAAAEFEEGKLDKFVSFHAERFADASGGGQLEKMTLPVIGRQRVELVEAF